MLTDLMMYATIVFTKPHANTVIAYKMTITL